MGSIQGSLQNIEIDVAGGTSYKNLVCLSTSSVNTTVGTSSNQTNCGVLIAPNEPSMSISFDAVCEVSPSVAQVSYGSLLTAMVNKTQIAVRVQNPTVTGSSTGAAYYHQFAGYITSLTISQATGELIKFNGTISSNGTLDITV
jgi:hypothetical protein